MEAVAGTRGAGENVLLFSEILTKVNNAKDKPKKIAVLRQYDNAPLRQVLKGAFDKNIVWDLQQVTHHILLMRRVGTEHGILRNEAKRLWHFVKVQIMTLQKHKKKACLFKC